MIRLQVWLERADKCSFCSFVLKLSEAMCLQCILQYTTWILKATVSETQVEHALLQVEV